VWLNAYSDYVWFLYELEEYGDANDYTSKIGLKLIN